MLVKFISSQTGEMVMMADVARPLLKAMGKSCLARGVITQPEMLPAVEALNLFLQNQAEPPPLTEVEEAEIPAMIRPVGMRQRAWPLINMLSRTAQSKKPSHILWQAAADFEEPPVSV